MTLSAKSKSDIMHSLKKIAEKQFDQETLQSLLITIREYAPKGRLTREIGDFIAHPIRDKGIILEHLSKFSIKSSPPKDGKQVISISVAMPLHGKCLIEDLRKVVVDLGMDTKPIDDNHDDLLICYFGILHLTRLQIGKRDSRTLKISRRFYPLADGTQRLCIVSVGVAPRMINHLFYTDIKAKEVFGDLDSDDLDCETMLRVVRDGQSLKIILAS